MMKILCRACVFLLCLFYTLSAFPANHGVAVGYVPSRVYDRAEPKDIHGGLLSLWWEPRKFQGKQISLNFKSSAAYYRSNHRPTDKSLVILSLAPVFQARIGDKNHFYGFFEASAGPALLSKRHFVNRDLGMQFAFHDMVGLGIGWHNKRTYILEAQIVHYSNADFAKHNPGITIPLMIRFGIKA